MGQQVTSHSGTSSANVEPPKARTTLRKFGVDGPILKKLGAVVEYPAKAALVDELFGKSNRRDSAVIVPNHVVNIGLFDGFNHPQPLLAVERQRFFAHDHLASLSSGDGDFSVAVIGGTDINNVDILAVNQLPPIGLDVVVTP